MMRTSFGREIDWHGTSYEIEKFFGNPKVATALLLLDYSPIRLTREGRRAKKGEEGVRIDETILGSSLRVHREFKDDTESFSSEEMLCREAFDEMLSGLERFEHYITTGLVTVENLRPYLSYWIRLLSNSDSGRRDKPFYSHLTKFITEYGYEGVQLLLKRFHNAAPLGGR